MSTHFTRRGGSPAPPDEQSGERPRERRFHRDRGGAEDVPTSPLVAEQEDPELRTGAPVRDRAAAPPASGGRQGARLVTPSGLNVVAGIWLILAPFILGYGNGDPYWNDIVFGAITALIGLAGVLRWRPLPSLGWIGALVGLWIFVSAFWLDDTGTATANDLIVGALVCVFAIASATDERWLARRRRQPT